MPRLLIDLLLLGRTASSLVLEMSVSLTIGEWWGDLIEGNIKAVLFLGKPLIPLLWQLSCVKRK